MEQTSYLEVFRDEQIIFGGILPFPLLRVGTEWRFLLVQHFLFQTNLASSTSLKDYANLLTNQIATLPQTGKKPILSDTETDSQNFKPKNLANVKYSGFCIYCYI